MFDLYFFIRILIFRKQVLKLKKLSILYGFRIPSHASLKRFQSFKAVPLISLEYLMFI